MSILTSDSSNTKKKRSSLNNNNNNRIETASTAVRSPSREDLSLTTAAKDGDIDTLTSLISSLEMITDASPTEPSSPSKSRRNSRNKNNSIDINTQDQFGSTPLHFSVFNGRVAFVERLLAVRGIDINAKDLYGRTPCFHAARYGHADILMQLVQHGDCDYRGGTDHGETPLMKAASYGHFDCVRILLEASKNPALNGFYVSSPHPESSPLRKSSTNLEKALSNGWINDRDESYGNTALHGAALKGHKEIVKLLLDYGADVNVVNNQGNTPLHIAVLYKQEEVALLLVSHGANVEVKNLINKSPLEDALSYDRNFATQLHSHFVGYHLQELKKKKKSTVGPT